jgi:hypothetical protein
LAVSQLLTLYITPVFYIYMEQFRELTSRRRSSRIRSVAPVPETIVKG